MDVGWSESRYSLFNCGAAPLEEGGFCFRCIHAIVVGECVSVPEGNRLSSPVRESQLTSVGCRLGQNVTGI
jgi:hypothetical protein